MNKKQIYLPRCVSKQELRNYFGVSPIYFREQILTEDLLQAWGFDYETYKSQKILGPRLTEKIYLHFKITNLRSTLVDELSSRQDPCVKE